MKLLRLASTVLLMVVMFLCVSPIAHAEGDNPPDVEDPLPEEAGDNPGPSIVVDILVDGDSPEVNIGVVGDNPDVNLGIGGDNPNVFVNGQNLNNPTAIYNITNNNSGGGSDGTFYLNKIKKLREDLTQTNLHLDLAAEGLAKLIMKSYGHDDSLMGISWTITDNTEDITELLVLLESQELKLRAGAGADYELLTQLETLQQQVSYQNEQIEYLETYVATLNLWLWVALGLGGAAVLGLLAMVIRRRAL